MKRLFVGFCAMMGVWGAEAFLVNSDFEQVDENGKPVGWYLPEKYSWGKTVGSNGSAGIFLNSDGTPNRGYLSQSFDVVPGATYGFGGWIRAENLPRDGKGKCCVCFSWHDANGKWMGETYSETIRNETDGVFKKCDGISKVIPEGAVRGHVSLVCDQQRLGKFYADRFWCERYVRKPVAGVYTSVYRATAAEGDAPFAAALTPEAFGCPAREIAARFTVKRPGGQAFSVSGMIEKNVARAVIPVTRFELGANEVTCQLLRGEREIGAGTMTFTRTEKPVARRVLIDQYGRTVKDGKLFFPFGMYTSQKMTEKDFVRYKEAPFNLVMQYGPPTREQLDRYQKYGINVIYDLTCWFRQPDAGSNSVIRTIKSFANHPAVFAWYLFDEQPVSAVPRLLERRNLILSMDADHPIWCAQDLYSETRHFIGTVDAFGLDPYPIPQRPISTVSDVMKQETELLMGMRPIWQVVQSFGWSWHNHNGLRRPTEAEVRNMAWQALAGGARGIVFYSNGYLVNGNTESESVEKIWAEWVRVAKEVMTHERVFLFAETAAIPASELPKGIVGRVFCEDGEMWRLRVNTTGDAVGDLPPLGVSMTPVLSNERTLFFAGDSTLDDSGLSRGGQPRPPYASWGTTLARSMKKGCRVRNYAQSGHSTKMFQDRGYWQRIKGEVRAGDFVVIQFGHNDQKHTTAEQVKTLFAAPETDYKANLRTFAADIRAKGATPVFCTPIVRATFNEEGNKLTDTTWQKDGITLGSYAKAVCETGAELGVDIVDMNALTGALCEKLGREEAYKFYVISTGVEFSKDGEPSKDVTHPTKAGAEAFAQLFLDDVRTRKLPISDLFK